MQVLFHKHVWLYWEYRPTLHWWTGASSVSPYVIIVAWGITSDVIIHHWSIAYELFTYWSLLRYFAIATITIATKLLLLLLCYRYFHITLLLNTLLRILSYPGVVELTTQLLILENILWLPLCRINKFGLNTLPSKTVVIPYTCGLSRPFSGAVAREHSYICWSLWRTWKAQEPWFFPQLRGEVRNCHLALH